MLGTRSVRRGQQHPALNFRGGKLSLPYGLPWTQNIGLAERHAMVGAGPDVGIGKGRHDRRAAVGFVQPEFLVRRIEQQVHPRRHVARNAQKVAEPPGVGRPGDQGDIGLDALEPRLHPLDRVFHPAVGPVLIAAKRGIVQVGLGISAPVSAR